MAKCKKGELNNRTIIKIMEFFKKYHFVYDDFDFDKEVRRFMHEMDLGLRDDGMLPMIPTYVDGDLHTKENKKVITIDIGGTNLRIAVVEIIDNKTIVSNVYKSKLPGVDNVIDFIDFIDILANVTKPYLKISNMISLSFAHQVEHNCNLDGYVIEISKELRIEDIEGKALADSLKTRLAEYGYKDVQVVLINDTVGVACSMIQKSEEYSSCIGIVMGTGTNSTYVEETRNIKKISDGKSDKMFINIESGDYIPSIFSDFDMEYNNLTQKPNTAHLEKMVSGRYLGELFYFIICKACEASLLSEEFKDRVMKYESVDTKQMSKFYMDQESDSKYSRACQTKDDAEILYFICEKLIVRAAYLIAIKIIAIAKKAVKEDEKPICCIVEGTTYFGLKDFDKMVKSIVDKYSKSNNIEIYSVEDAALKGIGNIGISMIN